jgi:DUF1365 family protein
VSSAVYDGTIRHRRFAVREHALHHRIALAYLDLDDLPRSVTGRGLVRFRRSDYLPGPGSLADAARTLAGTDGPVTLLANLRSFGYCFNPVSLFYCHDAAGALQSVIAEVTNTPWGERHAYVLSGDGPVLRDSVAKLLHVSPFMGMDHVYELRATAPAETLSVHIESRREDRVALDVTLRLRRRAFSRRPLAVSALRTLPLIYAHAVVLKAKGVPVHPHPAAS